MSRQLSILITALIPVAGSGLQAQQKQAVPAIQSAPISNIRYELTFDSATARQRTIQVLMSFEVTQSGPVLLSLPAWAPGAYEISNFSRWVSEFSADAGGKPAAWDKLDYDTWRVQPAAARSVNVRFHYLADSLDNAMAWSRPDFVLFNGTN